jgi:4a-hydroxytetrahydrobiopterin dehydratase
MATLDAAQIASKLAALPGWEHHADSIRKQYKFKEFMDGIRFVEKIANIAETDDHHPDILINYTRVTFTCSTHSAGGVTEKDVHLAAQIEAVYKSARAQ